MKNPIAQRLELDLPAFFFVFVHVGKRKSDRHRWGFETGKSWRPFQLEGLLAFLLFVFCLFFTAIMTSHVDDFWSQDELQEKDAQLRKLEAELLAFEERQVSLGFIRKSFLNLPLFLFSRTPIMWVWMCQGQNLIFFFSQNLSAPSADTVPTPMVTSMVEEVVKKVHMWLMHAYDMIHSTWLLHMCDMTHSRDMTHSYVQHDQLICVTWLIHMCATWSYIYTWHDAFICVT